MKSPTEKLLNFVMDINFEDLPDDVVHESKRVLLDSIGVALAGLDVDKGRYGIALAKRFGGAPESTILGTDSKVSCASAAFANGELINALDYDALLYPTHAPPCVIPAELAIGETIGTSGKEIVLAIAISFELSIRLGLAIRGPKVVFSDEKESEIGKIVGTKYAASVLGPAVVAGLAGAGRILNLNREKMANAIGLAGHFTPFPQAKWIYSSIMPMNKYISGGWASLGVVSAALLAEMGYTGDTTILDGDLGFWRFFGSDLWDENALMEELGQTWKWPEEIHYKSYPTCRSYHVALDCFSKIVEENKLLPEEIDEVNIKTTPWLSFPFHAKNKITDHISAQFCLAFALASIAYRKNPAEWQKYENLKDPKILHFMDRVTSKLYQDEASTNIQQPQSNMTTVKVISKGGIFQKKAMHAKGSSHALMTDDELVDKFRSNASKLLSKNKIEKAVDILLDLEKIKNISLLIKQVSIL